MPITLNANAMYSTLTNMIISEYTFSNNIKGTNSSLLEANRVDGTLYGDKKVYISTKPLKTYAYGAPARTQDSSYNVLEPFFPANPDVQTITMDVFRQIRLTQENIFSKQAWLDEGSFSTFTSTMIGWLNDTKKIYEATTYNAYLGTHSATNAKADVEIPLSDITETGEAKNRLEAQMIAQYLADVFVDLTDINTLNDFGNLRSYDESDFVVVWNKKFKNKILTIDLPTMFHKDLDLKMGEYTLPERYFGEINAQGGTTTSSNTTVRALVELDFNTVEVGNPAYDFSKHCFAGDLLPNSTAYQANTTYTVDEDVICKIIHKGGVPFMSAFSMGTEFVNPRNHTVNRYVTFGHNTIEALKEYPYITVHTD